MQTSSLNTKSSNFMAIVLLKDGKTFETLISAQSKSDANEIVRKDIATDDIISVGICPAYLYNKQVA